MVTVGPPVVYILVLCSITQTSVVLSGSVRSMPTPFPVFALVFSFLLPFIQFWVYAVIEYALAWRAGARIGYQSKSSPESSTLQVHSHSSPIVCMIAFSVVSADRRFRRLDPFHHLRCGPCLQSLLLPADFRLSHLGSLCHRPRHLLGRPDLAHSRPLPQARSHQVEERQEGLSGRGLHFIHWHFTPSCFFEVLASNFGW